MRISDREKTAILSAVRAKDPGSKVFLFGSRARDDLRGGDIDLLVLSDVIRFADRIDILVRIKLQVGEQRIDLKVVSPSKAAGDPFVQSILPDAILLCE